MSLHKLTIFRGAAAALIPGAVASLANVVLADQDPKPQLLLNLSYLAIIAAFFIGGFVAGREAPGDRARHGALAGLLAFVPIQVVGLLGRSDRGEPIVLGSILFLGVLAAVAGTLGALIGTRRNPRSTP